MRYAFIKLSAIAAGLRRGEVTATQLAEEAIDNHQNNDAALQAYKSWDAPGALAQAAAADKAFAAGADIAMMRDKSFVDVFAGDLFTPETDQIMRVRKPIIAAVSGYALGGGCELAMMCDFIICSESAKFGQPEINLGVVAGIGGTQRLTRAIGKSKAMDMNLTGRFMDAAEAERAGLVSRVVPVKKLMEEAMAAAAKIAEKSMISTMVVKEAVNRSFEVPLREGLLFERRIFHSLFATEDQKEGMSAFLEKREAQFRDK